MKQIKIKETRGNVICTKLNYAKSYEIEMERVTSELSAEVCLLYNGSYSVRLNFQFLRATALP
jgi:hypothetical protein